MGDVRVGSTFGSAITVRQVRHRTLEYFETQYCNGVASTIIESRSGRRESDQSIDQDLDLGFRSGDGKLQYLILTLFNGFGVRYIDHRGPIECIQPRQKSFLELRVFHGIGCRSVHLFGIGTQPRTVALAFVTVVHR